LKKGTADRHCSGRSSTMGVGDRMENTAEDLGGKAKEAAGKLTDDERLEAEGKAQQTKADLKNAGENVKEAADDVKDAFKR
jgi:uncharacterized protein YjbJ (UPF0337 family)